MNFTLLNEALWQNNKRITAVKRTGNYLQQIQAMCNSSCQYTWITIMVLVAIFLATLFIGVGLNALEITFIVHREKMKEPFNIVILSLALADLISSTVVISKNFNKRGSRHNHAHSLGVAQLQPCPYFQRWKYDNLVQYWYSIINNKICLNNYIAAHNWS